MELFHGTDANFSAFDMNFAVTTDRAANGFLGVWLATDMDHAKLYGANCLTVDAHVGKAETIPIWELSAWHREVGTRALDAQSELEATQIGREYYERKRNAFLAEGIDTLLIQESDDSIEIVIALLPENLKIMART